MTSQKNSSSTEVPDKPTLHEILLAEKMDFDAKLQRLQVTYKFYRIFLINITFQYDNLCGHIWD